MRIFGRKLRFSNLFSGIFWKSAVFFPVFFFPDFIEKVRFLPVNFRISSSWRPRETPFGGELKSKARGSTLLRTKEHELWKPMPSHTVILIGADFCLRASNGLRQSNVSEL